ncbi:MAG: hypothetical protein JXA21_24700 [Anaerolineae bacterium]|nr:hypothetical protein [Anaerolineae bacterium]
MNQDERARGKRLVRIVAVMMAIYALIEITDCITLVLMQSGVIANPYPQMAFAQFDALFSSQPLTMLPVFLFFASLRGLSALGLFRERMWGFWTTALVCVTTLLWMPFLMPTSGIFPAEMLMDGAILFLLLVGRFGSQLIYG